MTTRLATALAASLLLAGAARAQISLPPQPRAPPLAPRPDGARPAPAPDPGDARRGQAPADGRQRSVLAALHQRNALAAELGALAQQRGASREVRDLGRRLADDHRRSDGELLALARERGVDPARAPAGDERTRHDALVARLSRLSGPDFDRAFLAEIEPRALHDQDELKRMRDETPGQDARLKSWLDRTEDAAEAHVAAVRQARDAVGKRAQARHGAPPEGEGRPRPREGRPQPAPPR